MEYCGIDLHAEYSQICILDEDGEVMETLRVRTSRKALERFFQRDRKRVVMEAGGIGARRKNVNNVPVSLTREGFA